MSGWKPGTVAELTAADGDRFFAFWDAFNEVWVSDDVGRLYLEEPAVRPLVVIDPEDAEQVARLAAAWDELADKHAALPPVPMTLSELRMQAALRESAAPTPPKPDEPQGLGAVVEDAEGKVWLRVVAGYAGNAWQCPPVTGPMCRHWDDLAAVRVLSEGVTP